MFYSKVKDFQGFKKDRNLIFFLIEEKGCLDYYGTLRVDKGGVGVGWLGVLLCSILVGTWFWYLRKFNLNI